MLKPLMILCVSFGHICQMFQMRPSSSHLFLFVLALATLLISDFSYFASIKANQRRTKPPLPLEKLPSTSLKYLKMVSMEMDIPIIKREPEISWSLPARVHFIWIGPTMIKDKYVTNINNFCQHNPDYQVLKFEAILSISYSGDTLAGEKLYNKPSFQPSRNQGCEYSYRCLGQ